MGLQIQICCLRPKSLGTLPLLIGASSDDGRKEPHLHQESQGCWATLADVLRVCTLPPTLAASTLSSASSSLPYSISHFQSFKKMLFSPLFFILLLSCIQPMDVIVPAHPLSLNVNIHILRASLKLLISLAPSVSLQNPTV